MLSRKTTSIDAFSQRQEATKQNNKSHLLLRQQQRKELNAHMYILVPRPDVVFTLAIRRIQAGKVRTGQDARPGSFGVPLGFITGEVLVEPVTICNQNQKL